MALGLADGLFFLVALGCPAAVIVGMLGPVQGGGMKLDTAFTWHPILMCPGCLDLFYKRGSKPGSWGGGVGVFGFACNFIYIYIYICMLASIIVSFLLPTFAPAPSNYPLRWDIAQYPHHSGYFEVH